MNILLLVWPKAKRKATMMPVRLSKICDLPVELVEMSELLTDYLPGLRVFGTHAQSI